MGFVIGLQGDGSKFQYYIMFSRNVAFTSKMVSVCLYNGLACYGFNEKCQKEIVFLTDLNC